MELGILCARRIAILAALAGGFMIAVLGAGVVTTGILWGGGACLNAMRSLLASLGL